MKKIIFLLLFISMASFTYAQHLSAINYQISRDIMKAKEMIDQYLADPKKAGKAEGWYYKGKIYYQLSKEEPSACADCTMDAFNAFKRYQDLDPKNTFMHSTQNAELFDMYNEYFEIGEKAYIKKNYKGALYDFQKAAQIAAYIKSKDFSYNGFKFPPLDTLLVSDLAVTARADNDDSDAIVYYKQLTNANLKDSEYIDDYKYVADYYKKKNEKDSLATAIAKGKSLFPKDPYWSLMEEKKIDQEAEADLSMARSFYNRSLDYKDSVKKIKGWETADFQKRNRLKDSADAAILYAIPYGEAAAKAYEGTADRANYIQSLRLLKDIYTAEHNTTKAREYSNKLNSINSGKTGNTTTTVSTKKVITTVVKPIVAAPVADGSDLSIAQSFYKRSLDYKDSVKKAKGWETADFQKRKRLKDSSDAAIATAIPYAEAAVKTHATDVDKTTYIQSSTLLNNLYAAQHNTTKVTQSNGNSTTTTVTTVTTEKVTTPVATTATIDAKPGVNLSTAQSFYQQSLDYKQAIKQVKGWETADFQKRKKLKDSSDAAITQAIVYGEAAAKGYEAIKGLSGTDKSNYLKTLSLLQDLYTAKHDDVKAAEYGAKLRTAL
jgi:hypothetical protein